MKRPNYAHFAMLRKLPLAGRHLTCLSRTNRHSMPVI